jgi:hypothetical protein
MNRGLHSAQRDLAAMKRRRETRVRNHPI